MNNSTTAVMRTMLTIPKLAPNAGPKLLDCAKTNSDETFQFMVSDACSKVVGIMLQQVREGRLKEETRAKFLAFSNELIEIFHENGGKDIDHQSVRDAIIFDLS